MNRFIIITLSILLAVSVALNVSFFQRLIKQNDREMVSISENMKFDDRVLYLLEKGEIESAKSILSEYVGNRALIVGLCIEDECVGKEALSRITPKP